MHTEETILKFFETNFKPRLDLVNYLVNWSAQHKYIYVETPKVGCTTIKHFLQNAERSINSTIDYSLVHDRRSSPLLSPRSNYSIFIAAFNHSSFYKFCFVRNPYSRLLSAYLDKFVTDERERLRLSPKLGIPVSRKPSFLDFLCAIQEQTDGDRDIHWASQEHLLSPSTVRYSFVGRFENFQQSLSLIANVLGLQHFLSLEDTRHATNAGEKIAAYYSAREINLVQTIYERDFLSFGYGFDPHFIRNEKYQSPAG